MKPFFSARVCAVSAAVCAAAASAAFCGAVHAAPFAPHEATYKVSLMRADSASGLQNVRGAMQYRFADGCDGWISENTAAVEYLYTTGESVRSTWAFTSWEAKDGGAMRFAVTEKADGRITGQFAGRAELKPGGRGGTAWFENAQSGAEEEIIKLPPGTMLPFYHLRELFNAASGGERVVLRTVFDGTSADNPYSVNTVIGPGRAAAETAEIDSAGAMRTYPMRFAFFQVRAAGETPDVEMTVHYREDGVAERAVQDFEDYSIALEPGAVRFTETGGC